MVYSLHKHRPDRHAQTAHDSTAAPRLASDAISLSRSAAFRQALRLRAWHDEHTVGLQVDTYQEIRSHLPYTPEWL